MTSRLSLLILTFALACGGQQSAPTPTPTPTPTDDMPSPTIPPTTSEITRDSGAKVWINDFGTVQVHTFMAPFKMFANASQIVVTANSIVVVDPNMTIDMATDLRAYIDSLGKPIERLIVSHAHPDHYFGLAVAFEDVDSYALQSTIDDISSKGEETRKARAQMFPPGWVVDHITAPKMALEPGSFVVDGLEWNAMAADLAEHPHQLVLTVPSLRLAIAQDLVYTCSHPVITDRTALQSWSSHLDTISSGKPALVLGGHGPPSDLEGVSFMKSYLAKAKELLDSGADAKAFQMGMTAAYPNLGGEDFLKFSLFYLFPPAK